MSRTIHLVGEFPGWKTAEIIAAIRKHLGEAAARYPLAEPTTESLPSALTVFANMKAAGAIPAFARAQVSYVIGQAWADGEDAEIPTFVVNPGIPAQALSVQIVFPLWDLMAREQRPQAQPILRRQAVAHLRRLIAAVSSNAEISVHFCCRDGARYTMTPHDMAAMVDLSNHLMATASPSVALLHFPTPLRHPNDGFFRELAGLNPAGRQVLCLGLIHLSDGLEGALHRAALAARYVDGFAIAARCGFAARNTDDIPHFLDLHHQVWARLSGGN